MIVTSRLKLRQACSPANLEEGIEIGRQLRTVLERHNRRNIKYAKKGKPAQFGVGLAAPQIGVYKQVCTLGIRPADVLINPVIESHSELMIPFREGCLSFPGRVVSTFRYAWVKVRTLNRAEHTMYGAFHLDDMTPEKILESVLAQHEIAHLYGLLMEDFVSDGYPPPEQWEEWSRSKS